MWPRYRVAADMQDGDFLLMDAHEWHGNTRIRPFHDASVHGDPEADFRPMPDECAGCSAERITVVAYYRTRLETCGTAEAERLRAETYAARANAKTEAAADAAALASLTTTDTT